jgi:hypothetical protein
MKHVIGCMVGLLVLTGCGAVDSEPGQPSSNKRRATITGTNGVSILVQELWWGGAAQPASYANEAGDDYWDLDMEYTSGQGLDVRFTELASVQVLGRDASAGPDFYRVRLTTLSGGVYEGVNYNVRSVKMRFTSETTPVNAAAPFPATNSLALVQEGGNLYGQTMVMYVQSIVFAQ